MKVVVVEASDWGVVSEGQHPINAEFRTVRGYVIGLLLSNTAEGVVVAHHHFVNEGQVRHVTAIPRGNIINLWQVDIDPEKLIAQAQSPSEPPPAEEPEGTSKVYVIK